MLFFKVPANQTTTFDTKLFTIRLDIAKATSINIEYIILITSSLDFVKRTVDCSIYLDKLIP